MNIKIRLAKKADAKRLLELYNSSKNLWFINLNKARYDIQEILEYISDKKSRLFVSEQNKIVTGFLFAEFHSDYIYLNTIHVDKKYSHHGIGTELMNRLEKEARKEKKSVIEAITGVKNHNMQNVFKKLNYNKGKKFVAYEKFL